MDAALAPEVLREVPGDGLLPCCLCEDLNRPRQPDNQDSVLQVAAIGSVLPGFFSLADLAAMLNLLS